MKYILFVCLIATILSHPYLVESGTPTEGIAPENTASAKEPAYYLNHTDVNISNNGDIRITGYLKNASITFAPEDNRIGIALEMDYLSTANDKILARGYCFPEDAGQIIFPQELHGSPVEVIIREGAYIYPIKSIQPLGNGTANISVAQLEHKMKKIIELHGQPKEVCVISLTA